MVIENVDIKIYANQKHEKGGVMPQRKRSLLKKTFCNHSYSEDCINCQKETPMDKPKKYILNTIMLTKNFNPELLTRAELDGLVEIGWLEEVKEDEKLIDKINDYLVRSGSLNVVPSPAALSLVAKSHMKEVVEKWIAKDIGKAIPYNFVEYYQKRHDDLLKMIEES